MKKLLLILLIASSTIASDNEMGLELPQIPEQDLPSTAKATPHALELVEWLDRKVDSLDYDCCNRDICFCRSLCMFLLCCLCHEA